MGFSIGRKLQEAKDRNARTITAPKLYQETGDKRFLDIKNELDLINLKTTRAKEETARIKADADLTEVNTNQLLEKARRADMFAENQEQGGTGSNGRAMLSGLTGFTKIRRKVLGSLGGLGSSDEKLGG